MGIVLSVERALEAEKTVSNSGLENSQIALLAIAFALFAGLVMSRIMKPLKFPAVTGYLIAGILVGPSVLGQIPGFDRYITPDLISSLSVVSDVALGFIAFSIGSEFKMSVLKKVGKQAVVIALFESLMAVLLVDAALIGLHFIIPDKLPVSAALTLGAIASATAPAATMMVVKQYKAKGKVTEVLLPVVALDDAIGLIAFAVSFGIAQAVQSNGGSIDVISVVINPLLEIFLSLLIGGLLGGLLNLAEKIFKSNSKRLCLAVSFVFLTVSLAVLAEKGDWRIGDVEIRYSSLLTSMMLGTAFCNICSAADEIMEKTDKWTMPIYILFFVFSGAVFQGPIADPDRFGLHSYPGGREVLRCPLGCHTFQGRSEGAQVFRLYPHSPGRRCPWDVSDGSQRFPCGRRTDHPEHRSFRSIDL